VSIHVKPMGLMDVIRRMANKKSERSEKFKQMEEDYRLNKMLMDRQKSSNERELEGYMKKKREENIKRQLDMIHKKQTSDAWSNHSILKSSNILKEDKKIMADDRPILHQKNIFLDNKTKIPLSGNEMFFQW
jgi:hypothetical protein